MNIVHFVDGPLEGQAKEILEEMDHWDHQAYDNGRKQRLYELGVIVMPPAVRYHIHRAQYLLATGVKIALAPVERFARYDSRDLPYLKLCGKLIYTSLLLDVEWKFGFSQPNTSGIVGITGRKPSRVRPCYFQHPGYTAFDDLPKLIDDAKAVPDEINPGLFCPITGRRIRPLEYIPSGS